MNLRSLGLNAQELEAGPLLVLLSHSIPVAYRDSRPEARAPGLYRTDRRFNKAFTRHINKWLEDKGPYAVVPHDVIVRAFESISRFTPQPATPPPSPEAIAGALEYMAGLARQAGGR